VSCLLLLPSLLLSPPLSPSPFLSLAPTNNKQSINAARQQQQAAVAAASIRQQAEAVFAAPAASPVKCKGHDTHKQRHIKNPATHFTAMAGPIWKKCEWSNDGFIGNAVRVHN